MANRNLRVVDGEDGGEYDPFKLERAEPYSPDKFYTASTNKNDHSAKTTLYSPPNDIAAISNLIALRTFPQYKNYQDFVRDACHHRLEYLADKANDPRWQKYADERRHMIQMGELEREMQDRADELKQAEKMLQQATEIEDRVMLEDVLNRLEIRIEALREPYRTNLYNMCVKAKKKLGS